MANGQQWTVTVPDRRDSLSFNSSFTPEEVRAALVSTGYTSVENADLVVSGNSITFRRPTGGTKGR